MKTPRVLVVDDEPTIRHVLVGLLDENGCDVRAAGSAEEALSALDGWEPEVALLDLVLPGRNGLELLGDIKQRYGDTEVVVITSHSSASTALTAMRLGAFDYLEKPLDIDPVWETVLRALDKRALKLETRDLLDRQDRLEREWSTAVSIEGEDPPEEFASYREIVEHYLDVVTDKLGVDRASLMLLNPSTGELEVVAHRGFPEGQERRFQVRLGEGISGAVAKTGEPFLVTDAANDPRIKRPRPHLSDSFISAPIALSVAIKSGPEVLGVINVTNRRTGKPLATEDLSFLSALAGQLAVAIDATRRSERLRRAYQSLKTAQHQLVFSEKIKAVGQMAAGVAHDFNNALSVILARAQFVRRMLDGPAPDMDKIRADLDTVIKISFQGAEMIKRIQDYTRIRKDVPRSAVDLNAVIRDAVEMARPKWKEECDVQGTPIDMRLELGDIPTVSGNEYELAQVVGNFIFNAVEAMPKGGALTFRTFAEANRVVMQVRDTGIGMDETTRERLFDPFFTTKETGQGLGTSIIYGIVTRHRGTIRVDSRLGCGTTFTVRFPVGRPLPRRVAPQPQTQPEPIRTRAARVLLVDDDELVRETYEETLRSGGHDVCSVGGGSEALAEFAEQPFDVVVTDLSMHEMSGFDLSREIKRLYPGVPVILLSGWAIQENEERVRESGIDHVLVKPCRVEDLLSAVQNALRANANACA